VDDGSRDRSMEIVRALGAENPRVKYVVLSRNFGHQVALSAGLDHARGSAVAIIDADLQDPPELLAEMHAKLRGGFQVVYAQRRSRKDKSLVKKVAYKVFYRLLARLSQIEIPLDTGDFRIMDRKVVDALRAMPEQHKFLRGQVAWVGFDHAAVEYDRDARHAGAPGYTWRKLFLLAVDGITSFSDVPLRLATFAGLIVSFVAFLLIVYALVSYFYKRAHAPGLDLADGLRPVPRRHPVAQHRHHRRVHRPIGQRRAPQAAVLRQGHQLDALGLRPGASPRAS
jgi:glycosyltransferase involved in cell wall biosynthesis